MSKRGFQGRLVIAGATGPLGNEVMRLLVGQQMFREVLVLAREPITAGVRGVQTAVVTGDEPHAWPRVAADAAVVMFDPPRLFYERERALWTPRPEQLPALASWLHGCGVTSVAVVMPHTQMRLPEAIKHGLANLDEQAVSALAFDRLLIVRAARNPEKSTAGHPLARLAHWMLSVGKYMVPSSEQPVRSTKVAEFVSHALRLAPPGIFVAGPETVWQAAQGDVRAGVARWLAP